MEIEKKFLLRQLPEKNILGEGVPIKQGYLQTEGGELRARLKGNNAYLTVKGDGTLAREEWESEIPLWVFQTVWPSTEGRRVEKTRYDVNFKSLTLEVDVYEKGLAGLLTMECEFDSEEAAAKFVLPLWAIDAVDVTADKAYKNKALAVKGLPSLPKPE